MEIGVLAFFGILVIVLLVGVQRGWWKSAKVGDFEIEGREELSTDVAVRKSSDLAVVRDLPVAGGKPDVQVQTPDWLRNVDLDLDIYFGRQDKLEEIGELVRRGPTGSITAIKGVGGIGKTATALVAVKETAGSVYSMIGWASFRPNVAIADFELDRSPQTARLSHREIIRSLAIQLGLTIDLREDVILDEFKRQLSVLSQSEAVILVIDNLERNEDVQSIVELFAKREILESCHIVLATRTLSGSQGNVNRVELAPLEIEASFDLIRHEGRASEEVRSASNKDLKPIHAATDGNPYLMKLAARRLAHGARPLALLIRDMQTLRDGEATSLGRRIERYMFRSSIEQLEESSGRSNARGLLHAFVAEPAGSKVSHDDLQAYSGLSEGDLAATISAANDLSLVTAHNISGRYSVHSLLHTYMTASRDSRD